MTIGQSFLAALEHEAAVTRKFLERLPEDRLTWKPHERSMSAGQLAYHLATTPGQVVEMASKDDAVAPDFSQGNPQPTSVKEVLEAPERSVQAVKQLLPKLDDTAMERTWRALKDGREMIAMPRVVFLRNIMLNHWYQHRGQFSVYLRLMGQKVPASYGPSADEMPEFMQQKAAVSWPATNVWPRACGARWRGARAWRSAACSAESASCSTATCAAA